jgi:hypothetical protein
VTTENGVVATREEEARAHPTIFCSDCTLDRLKTGRLDDDKLLLLKTLVNRN